MEPERGEALGEWGGGGREGEGGSVAFTDPCAHHKEGGVGCLCLLRGFVLFIFFPPASVFISKTPSPPPSPLLLLIVPLLLLFRKRIGCNHATRGGRCSILIIIRTADKKRRTAGV